MTDISTLNDVQKIIVLDYGSQYNQLIARRIREFGVFSELKSHKITADEVRAIDPIGIVLSGGPNSVYAEDAFGIDEEIFELGIPILGICYGMQLLTHKLGGKVVAISGPDGVCEIPDGITPEMIDYMLEMRNSNRNKVEDMATKFPGKAKFTAGKKAWSIPVDIALPCAFQNELSEDDAKELVANGCWCCCEVSNMGCQPGAIHYFQKNGILFAPGKAVNAGGVATSGLEMTQNAAHLNWAPAEVNEKLQWIMESIHEQCVKFGEQPDGTVDYVKGANIAGFMKVAQAMLEQGVI